jgi:hypothetical protein
MADSVRKVGYFSTAVSNRPGQGSRMLEVLRNSKVNLLGFTGFPDAGGAQIDFIPVDTGKFLRAAKRAKLRLRKKKIGFLVQGRDRVGAVADIMKKLAAARVNVTAIDAVSAGKGRFGAILWVKPNNVSKAARVLRAK